MGEVVAEAEAAIDPLIGTEVGGYRVEGFLGEGVVGKVYRARQLSLDRPVALKVLRPAMAEREEVLIRFRREAMAAANVTHPHLVEVFDVGEVGGTYFYAMELVEGSSLARCIERGERFSEAECVEVGRQALSALDAAHRAGIVHRDVEPGNLLLDPKGCVKLGDLGVAHFCAGEADAALTQPGVSLGTLGYMSPEQAQGLGQVDYRADFYGLGATLFHLATGHAPFEGKGLLEIISSHISAPVPCARDANHALGRRFSDLIRWLMAKSPADRPQTHAEIYGELERCRRPDAAGDATVPRIPFSDAARVETLRRQDSWMVAVAVVAVAVVIALGILAMRAVLREYKPDAVLGDPDRGAEVVPGSGG